ncbi:hypothetical protein RN001_011897 [Aquatica leii]|uniref:Uncharacterized protein n=1 Tax=Aquatica leii TaxID=1421715 RepID=A0AAN7SPA0_9COLE|nr:hypothetical protein RN001_011897 [Aquatica leii]
MKLRMIEKKHRQQYTITLINTPATPLQFHYQTYNPLDNITATYTRKTNWKEKTLHGKHLNQLMQPHIDHKASNTWLRKGNIYYETEGFMVAIQDQVIKTRYYSKLIIKDPNTSTDKCRLCKQQIETIDHIITGCTTLANTEYTRRHNNIAKIIHQQLSKHHKFTEHTYTQKKLTKLIEISVPNTVYIQKETGEKIEKYIQLAEEIKDMWHQDRVKVVPIMLSATGVIPHNLHKCIETLELHRNIYIQLQKSIIIDTCSITRKFLNAQ